MQIPSDKKTDTLHRAMHTFNCIHRRKAHEEFFKLGLTEGQPKILGYLKRNDGCIQRELAENCHVKASTVTSILSNMEKAELIARTSNPSDKRILNVFLTEKGKEANEKIETIFAKLDQESFQGFSEEEKINTIELLNRLIENIQKRKEEF